MSRPRPTVPVPLRLAALLLPRDVREEVLGDLIERWNLLVRERSRFARQVWAWRQPFAALAASIRFGRDAKDEGGSMRRRHSRFVIPWIEWRLGWRMLRRYPGLTFVAVVSLSIGVAGAVGVFTFTSNFLHPTLPLPDGHRVVGLQNWNVATNAPQPGSFDDYVTWRGELTSVRELGAARPFLRNVSLAEGPGEPVRGAEISPSAFLMVRVPPLLGRPLVEADERADDVAVIGHDLWQGAFGGDPAVVGRRLRVGDSRRTIVGVMPEGFGFPLNQSLWLPLRIERPSGADEEQGSVMVFGRLARGVDLEEAQAELSVLGSRAAADSPGTHGRLRPRVLPYAETLTSFSTAALVGVRSVIVLLLLVVCANVGALVFARNLAREGEIAVRTSLGASRRRITAQLFIEALVLATAASAVGLLLVGGVLRVASDVFLDAPDGPGALPFWWQDGLPPTAFGLVAVLTLVNAAICGLLPSYPLLRQQPRERLQRSGTGTSAPCLGRSVKAAIATQVALSVALLTVTLGMWPRLVRGESGFRGLATERYLTAELHREGERGSDEDRRRFFESFAESRRQLAERLGADPEVTGITYASALPGSLAEDVLIEAEGGALTEIPTLHRARVAPEYFDVLGPRLVTGRTFADSDVGPDGAARDVAVVTRAFARRRLGTEAAVGRRFRRAHPARTGPWLEVVGVVEDLGGENAGLEALYWPLSRDDYPVHVVIEARGDPERLVPRLREVGTEVDAALRITRVFPLSAVVESARTQRRVAFLGVLLATAMAVLLALGGIYAVMSFFVSRRTREIGIRTALGASRGRVTRDIFSRALHDLGIGVALSTAATVPFFAWGLEVGSARIALGVTVVIMVAGLMACVGPTLRILRVQPTEAMLAEG